MLDDLISPLGALAFFEAAGALLIFCADRPRGLPLYFGVLLLIASHDHVMRALQH